MHPFFAPRKRAAAAGGGGGGGASGLAAGGAPQSFSCWNVNSLGVRLAQNRGEFVRWLRKEAPDVLTLQEVKHAAHRIHERDVQGKLASKTGKQKEYLKAFNNLCSELAAEYPYIKLSLCAKKGYAGQAILVRRGVAHPRLSYCLDYHKPGRGKVHHPEGRVIVAHFDAARLIVVSTYVPNNGGTAESFARRAAWDARMEAGLVDLQARHPGWGLVWLGDLNCCTDEDDVSGDPAWWLKWKMGPPGPLEPAESGNRGQAGFTPNERLRFARIRARAKLVDPFRLMHTDVAGHKDVLSVEGPFFSWRGSPGRIARYSGKGMRIDYTLVSEGLVSRVVRADMTGQGTMCHGFMGSDHCPLMLVLRPPDDDDATAAATGGGGRRSGGSDSDGLRATEQEESASALVPAEGGGGGGDAVAVAGDSAADGHTSKKIRPSQSR